jgi:hypothetical protein
LVFAAPAAAFSTCTGVHVDVSDAGLEPATQIATFGDVIEWHLRSPYPRTTFAFDDSSCSVIFNGWLGVVGGLATAGCWPAAPGTYQYSVTGLWTGTGTIVVKPPPLQVLPSPVVYGDSAVLAGQVPTQIDCSGGPLGWTPPVIEVEPTLFAKPYGEGDSRPFATVTATGARGDFATLVTPVVGTMYQARLGDLATVTATVQVRPRIDLSRIGHRFAVKAFAGRSLAGARIEVQISRRPVKSLRLDGAGEARFTVRRHGNIRVFMSADQAGPGYVAGWSNSIRL